MVTFSQIRNCIGGEGVAMSASANCSKGKYLSEERFFPSTAALLQTFQRYRDCFDHVCRSHYCQTAGNRIVG